MLRMTKTICWKDFLQHTLALSDSIRKDGGIPSPLILGSITGRSARAGCGASPLPPCIIQVQVINAHPLVFVSLGGSGGWEQPVIHHKAADLGLWFTAFP